MWTREGLKEKAKVNFKRFYKQTVLVCIIVYLIGALFDGGFNSATNNIQTTVTYNQNQYYNQDEIGFDNGVINKTESMVNLSVNGLVKTFFENTFNLINKSLSAASMTVIVLVMICIMLVSIVARAILLNPIIVGKNNFFMGIREGERKIGDIFFLFEKSKFVRPAITMFLVDLFTGLWTLLLFIPGVIKSYEYKMIPYILSENPEIDRKRAFELSRHMMDGQKMDTFILDLSFIGWNILSSFTFGLLSIFYVNPYIESTYAELYGVLREDALQSQFANRDELPGFDVENRF